MKFHNVHEPVELYNELKTGEAGAKIERKITTSKVWLFEWQNFSYL